MKYGFQIFLAVLLLGNAPGGVSQGVAGVATVGAAREALVGAIDRLDTALSNQSQNVKGVGESLTANARSLLSDFDQRFQNKLDYTFDRLNDQEKRVVSDARTLTGQINKAASDLVTQIGDVAKTSLAEADILAYNSLYSIPCRTQIPRVVYATPGHIAANDVREVVLRGNFLAIGNAPDVKADGTPAVVIERIDNEMRVGLPAKIFEKLLSAHSISVEFTPLQKNRTNLWVTCWETEGKARPIQASVLVVPDTKFEIHAKIVPVADVPQSFDVPYGADENNDSCDANYDASKEFKVPDDAHLVGYTQPALMCDRCGSGVNAVRQLSDKSIKVDAHFQGCGYDSYNLMLTTVRNCKGRGCLHYAGVLHAQRTVAGPLDVDDQTIVAEGLKQTSFVLGYRKSLPAGATNVKWTYDVEVTRQSGNAIQRYQVSDSNPIVTGVHSRAGSDGKLNLELTDF